MPRLEDEAKVSKDGTARSYPDIAFSWVHSMVGRADVTSGLACVLGGGSRQPVVEQFAPQFRGYRSCPYLNGAGTACVE
jgi:hypothetical protein